MHIKEPKLKKTTVIDNDRPKRLNVVVAKKKKKKKKKGGCRTLILIMKMTLIPIIVCKFLAVKVIVLIQIFTFIDIKDILQIFTVLSF